MDTLVIAHRGASGHLPDHTLAAYALAIEQGADVIEPDLVATRDGRLIARHENELSGTTDVAVRFPDRRTEKLVDGERVGGWFSEDFTLAEIKTLRARQPLAERPHDHDGLYEVPTLEEILDLVAEKQRATGRRIGIEPETKHPSYFDALGLSLEEPLLRALAAHGYDGPEDACVVQSFEAGNLEELRRTTKLRLLRLFGDDVPGGLGSVRAYADAIGVPKTALIRPDGTVTDLVADAHAAGLEVHVYTFRSEVVLPWANGDPVAELRRFYTLGVDAVFADFPDVAVRARGR